LGRDKYKFEIVANELKLISKFDKIKIVDGLEEDFKKLILRHKENKKNYITRLTQENFITDYPYLSDLLSSISDDSFKRDKYYIRDFVKLSNRNIVKIFDTMRKDKEKGIDIDLIFDYILKTPNTKMNRNKRIKEQRAKSWKNR